MRLLAAVVMALVFAIVLSLLAISMSPARAGDVLMWLEAADGRITTTVMDLLEKCPEETTALFEKAKEKNLPVTIRLDGEQYEVLQIFCIGSKKESIDEPKRAVRPRRR